MTLGFCPFASSSSGNCYFIKSESTGILVDVGISALQICRNLQKLGLEPSAVHGVFLTHEHVDHVKSVLAFHKKCPSAGYLASAGTINGLDPEVVKKLEARSAIHPVDGAECITIGDLQVKHFPISHDAADPVAYTVEREGKKIAIVTDTGCVTESIYQAMEDADILVLEANHEENILLYGRYPYQVKRRILSDKGHLSNEAAGRCLCRVLAGMRGRKAPKVFLAHLSKENNTPEQAYLTVKNVLEEEDFYIGKDLELEVITAVNEKELTMI